MKIMRHFLIGLYLLYTLSGFAQTLTTDPGAEIDGIIWATRNVNAPGTFVNKPEDFGMLYQWNRKVGWSSTDPIRNSNNGTVWDKSIQKGNTWETANNICPAGWRVPTRTEQESLAKYLVDRMQNGVFGRVFKSGNNTVFLPEAGHRFYRDNGQLYGKNGYYWNNSTPVSPYNAITILSFENSDASGSVHWVFTGIDNGCSVRCVADFSISLDKNSRMLVGQEKTLNPVILPQTSINKTIAWSSSNPDAATVDANGKVTALAAGNTVITAQMDDLTADCNVEVCIPSTKVNLQSISENNNRFELTPAFSPDITEYTATVSYSMRDAICISAFAEDTNATISTNFKQCEYNLNVGKTTFTITVTAEDGETQKTYTLVVNREAPSTNADLQSINISGGYSYSVPNFNAEITDYRINVSYFTDYIYLSTINAHSGATVSYDRYKQLSMGENTFNITVTAEDKETQKTYTIIVNREEYEEVSKTVHLTEPGTLRTTLLSDTVVGSAMTKLIVTGDMDARDIYYLDSLQYLVELDFENANIVDFEGIIGYNRESKLYPANELPDNSFNRVLYVTSMVLPKTLTSIGNNVLNFDVSVLTTLVIPEGVTKIGSGFANYKHALTTVVLPSTLTEIGQRSLGIMDKLSAVINYNPTPINISGVFFTDPYITNKPTLYVPYGSGDLYREATGWKEFNIVELSNVLNNADLQHLYLSNAELTPAFNPDTTNYTVNIPFSVANIDGNGYTSDVNASIEGYDSYSGSFKFYKENLQVGENMIEITVVSGDGETQKTYTIVVNREAPSSNADLQSLRVYVNNKHVELTPAFSPDTTNYTMNVPYFVSSFEGDCSTVDNKASVYYNGRKTVKFYKNLDVGENTFEFTVTAEDSVTQKTYAIVVTREPLQERTITIHLDESGTLQNDSSLYHDNPITKLKITGDMDARDFWSLSDYDIFMDLTELDLSEANIVVYEGNTGFNRESTLYPANEIPNGSFSRHTMMNLTSIVLPKTLTSIGSGVLSIYTAIEEGSLTSIHIPEGVTKIDYGCFIGQNALTTISLPSTLTEIGVECFLNCNNLSVVVNHNPKPVETTCIFTCSSVGFGDDKPTLYVPYGSGNLYREATGWKELNIVELPAIPDGGISITPSEDNALIAWEPLENAEGYLLTIYKDEEHTQIERTVKFDANGQFVEELRSGSVGVPFSFLLDGLSDGTTYYYTLETFATNDVLLFSQSGEFTTMGETVGVVETGRAPSLRSVTGYYNILGVKLSKEPASGMYIILYSDGTAVKMVK